MSVIELFDHGVALGPSRPCLVFDGRVRLYAQVQAASCRVANALLRDGLTLGTNVAVLSPNAPSAVECVLGVLRAGCAWVPVDSRAPQQETLALLRAADVSVLFYAGACAPVAAEARRSLARIRRAVCIDGHGSGDTLDRWLQGVSDTRPEPVIPAEAIALLAADDIDEPPLRAAMISHRAWAFRAAQTLLRTPGPAPISLVTGPACGAAGVRMLELMAAGGTHVLLPGFDPAAATAAVGRHGVTHLELPSMALERLLGWPGVRKGQFGSLACLTYVGAQLSAERTAEAVEVFGPVLAHGYGSAEMGDCAAWLSPQDLLDALRAEDFRRLASRGRPNPLVRIEVMNELGHLLPAGAPGEIVVRSHGLASGRLGEDPSGEGMVRDGWLRTGDVGFKDRDCWVYVGDRKADVIVSAGMDVFPSDVESVLRSHPGVRDCAVVGAPHPLWGQAVTAVVELLPGASAGEAELKALCKESLASHQTPKAVQVWTELPRLADGRVSKRRVRERVWQELSEAG